MQESCVPVWQPRHRPILQELQQKSKWVDSRARVLQARMAKTHVLAQTRRPNRRTLWSIFTEIKTQNRNKFKKGVKSYLADLEHLILEIYIFLKVSKQLFRNWNHARPPLPPVWEYVKCFKAPKKKGIRKESLWYNYLQSILETVNLRTLIALLVFTSSRFK